jgi:hypothetical protein
MGDPLPANQEVLPAPDDLIDSDRLHGCAVDLGDRTAPAPQARTTDAADQQCETPASNGHCAIVPFDLLVPPGADDAITGKASKCAQCGKGGDVLETYIGTPTPVWLHRECADAWLASCDDLSIPVYLDRRSELRVGAGTTPDRGATNGGQL